jgi:putative ABC transport system ATP-binding protein/lipoprotein-releasing system ATP-binding protein
MTLVRCDGATRTFGSGATANVALQPTDCEIAAGERIALVGRSGSGKSTLLHLIAGLDLPTLGSVSWPEIGGIDDLRPGPVAIVFQGPSLLAPLSVLENTALPLQLAGVAAGEASSRARSALAEMDLAGIDDKLPEEISGGQAQRVAAARALVGEPRLILADEPTAQIDHELAAQVIGELLAVANRSGAAVLLATHDPEIASRLDRRWEMHNGRLDTGDGR